LVDLGAVAVDSLADKALSAAVAPSAHPLFDADGLFGPRRVVRGTNRVLALRLVAVDANKMTTEVVLATE